VERTVPRRGSDEITLYVRTYYSLLRSSREVQIKSLVEAHSRMNSALHVGSDQDSVDLAAFIYVILRLPACIDKTRLVVMGQSQKVFEEHGYGDVESWQEVSASGRRRRNYFDGRGTLAVYIASRSDIDDIVPSLTAYQIERNKLYYLFRGPEACALLARFRGETLTDGQLRTLAELSGMGTDDLDRLRSIWGEAMCGRLLEIAQAEYSVSVRLLAGSLADYKRATRRWWLNACQAAPPLRLEDRPVYFVSSNTHSLTNLLSSFALSRESELVRYIDEQGSDDLRTEYVDILERNVPSSRENFLYYVLKKYEADRPEVSRERLDQEKQLGIHRAPSQHVFDVEVQFVELSKLRPECLDPRLRGAGIERLRESDALIINIDFPLGMAAYQVLSEIARNIAGIRGVYIMGKAATLNGRIGDVIIPSMVYDEQSLNTYLFDNCFSADDVAPLLVYGTVMDNQKAISALGTFLQNENYMDVIYREGYTIIEMEDGPYLSSIYEMTRPKRYPRNEIVNIYHAPFPIGIVHYASDTPLSQGKNLGSQNLSYFGMDPTYAAMTAILQRILSAETSRN
jgi:hypothetical protein